MLLHGVIINLILDDLGLILCELRSHVIPQWYDLPYFENM
jgi:hypothetical protein